MNGREDWHNRRHRPTQIHDISDQQRSGRGPRPHETWRTAKTTGVSVIIGWRFPQPRIDARWVVPGWFEAETETLSDSGRSTILPVKAPKCRRILPRGVIGNTTGFGPVVPGSSPGGVICGWQSSRASADVQAINVQGTSRTRIEDGGSRIAIQESRRSFGISMPSSILATAPVSALNPHPSVRPHPRPQTPLQRSV